MDERSTYHPILGDSMRLFLALAAATLLALASGCSTTITTRSWEPARYNLGKATKLVVVQTTGRRSLREEIIASIQQCIQKNGWWRFEDRTGKGISIDLSGAKPVAKPSNPEPGMVYVRLDAYEWNSSNEHDDEHHYVVGRVSFGISTVNAQGAGKLVEKDFSANVKILDGDGARDRAMQQAIGEAVRLMLSDITPRSIRVHVQLDDEAEDMKSIAEMVQARSYDQARSALQNMGRSDPHRADVVYNIAVTLHAQGQLDEALKLYDKALGMGAKSFYSHGRNACAQRIEVRETMGK
jgi:tetratricopeptide (TPR) repeat protein